MSRRLDLSPAARLDIADAALWYFDQRAGLEEEFLAAVQTALDRIIENPNAFAFIRGDLRRAVAKRFPFSIIYEVIDHQITVIAVFHASRDPQDWQRRVTE